MEYRPLGSTGIRVSELCLGTMQFKWTTTEAVSHQVLNAFEKAGGNFIDTADIYSFWAKGLQGGESETIIGKWLKQRKNRRQIVLATKCRGRMWEGPTGEGLSRAHIVKACEDSLRRLQTDYIDLYQMHWPEPDEIIEEAWEAMVKLVDEGKVRYIAVCNFNVEQLRRIGAIQPVASLQPPYNMLRREIEEDILPYCQESKLGVVAYSPMQNGLLTGKFTLERIQNLPDDDFRKTLSEQFQSPQLDVNLKVVEGLRPIAQRLDHTLAQLALAWVLRRPEVTSAITGARKPGQIKETAMAAGWVLDEWTVQQIEALLNKRDKVLAEAN